MSCELTIHKVEAVRSNTHYLRDRNVWVRTILIRAEEPIEITLFSKQKKNLEVKGGKGWLG